MKALGFWLLLFIVLGIALAKLGEIVERMWQRHRNPDAFKDRHGNDRWK